MGELHSLAIWANAENRRATTMLVVATVVGRAEGRVVPKTRGAFSVRHEVISW